MNIIAVDDERLALMDLEIAIREAAPEADLLCFGNPREAVEFAGDNHIDIAYLDIMMPGLDGIELAKVLKGIHPRINIIFTTGYDDYAVDAFSVYASGFIMKPIAQKNIEESLKHLRAPIMTYEQNKPRVQCFGNFDIFVDGKPLYFPRKKAKELLAYLIHKRGTSSTIREISAEIYDNSEYSSSMEKQIQTVISTMMKTIKEAGIEDIVIKKFNSISIDTAKVTCDYYRFLAKEPAAADLYMGEYMSSYAWAEFKTEYLDVVLDK